MKKLASALLALLIAFSAVPGMAGNETEHNQMMCLILFGNKSFSPALENEKKALKALKDASYITLDQFNNFGKDKLEDLEKLDVSVPDFSEIYFSANYAHRRYTHRGWDFSYSPDDKAHWDIRKNILINTVAKVFDLRDKKKCNSFAALIYYIHILKDLEPQKNTSSFKREDNLIPLVRMHASDSNPDVIYELEKHLKIIFSDQKKTRIYKDMINELSALHYDAEELENKSNGRYEGEYFTKYKEIVEKVEKNLENNIHILLKNEDFFTKVFNY